jgi:hypothetical protein
MQSGVDLLISRRSVRHVLLLLWAFPTADKLQQRDTGDFKRKQGFTSSSRGAHSTKEDHHMRAELQQMRNQAVNISHEMMMLLRVVPY